MADVVARIERRSRRTESGCRLWLGARFPNGYGKITVGSRPEGTRAVVGVHRAAYREFVGPIPAGLDVLHRCDVRHCTEPTHLFLGTDLDNARDREAKGRGGGHTLRGERNPSARLTEADVVAVRCVAEGVKQHVVAERFGLRRSHVTRICRGRRWAHLPVFPYSGQRGGPRKAAR